MDRVNRVLAHVRPIGASATADGNHGASSDGVMSTPPPSATIAGDDDTTSLTDNASRVHDWTTHQRALPRLPIPPLRDTLARYLRAVRPLLSDGEFAARTRRSAAA